MILIYSPGRFFATNELKVLLCHIIINCEFKGLAAKRTEDSFFGFNRTPDTSVNLLIRNRKD